MINLIQKFFDENFQIETDGAHDLRLAAAALLFEIARADYDLDSSEKSMIHNLIADQFSLNLEETAQLFLLAEREATESVGLYEFTVLINKNWSIEERIRLVEKMWQVVYADGRLDDNEVHLMSKLQRLLHIPHRDYIAAKLRNRPT